MYLFTEHATLCDIYQTLLSLLCRNNDPKISEEFYARLVLISTGFHQAVKYKSKHKGIIIHRNKQHGQFP